MNAYLIETTYNVTVGMANGYPETEPCGVIEVVYAGSLCGAVAMFVQKYASRDIDPALLHIRLLAKGVGHNIAKFADDDDALWDKVWADKDAQS